MSQPLNVLIVEDSEADALLLLRELRKGDYAVRFKRVADPGAMYDALDEPWDVVIADHSMPHFSARSALRLMQDRGIDSPLIIVSGTMRSGEIVAAMRDGARDFILKGDF